jgi:hypothetical protein
MQVGLVVYTCQACKKPTTHRMVTVVIDDNGVCHEIIMKICVVCEQRKLREMIKE